ncbi:hypothetical protein ACQY0O_000339 [Thecaphora frezii]
MCESDGSFRPRSPTHPIHGFRHADWRVPVIKKQSQLAAVDQPKIDAREPGSLEATFVEHGVPAITLEISNAKV